MKNKILTIKIKYLDKMTHFNIGDYVLYTPDLPNPLPHEKRINDHGIVIGKKWGTHYRIDYYNSGYVSLVHYKALSLLYSNNNNIPNIIIKKGSYDPITFNEFQIGDIIIDFLRTDTQYESEFNTYYSEYSFNQLNETNPINNKKIEYGLIKKYRILFFN